MAKQGKCPSCRVRWWWRDVEVKLGVAKCPQCWAVLERTTRPVPNVKTKGLPFREVLPENVLGKKR